VCYTTPVLSGYVSVSELYVHGYDAAMAFWGSKSVLPFVAAAISFMTPSPDSYFCKVLRLLGLIETNGLAWYGRF
jgi:hypothetical protein